MVFDSIRTGFLAGLGLAVISADQARRVAQGFVEAGRITAEQAETLVRELMNVGREQTKGVQESMNDAVKSAVDSMDFVGGRDLKRLERRLESLEQRVALLETIRMADSQAGRAHPGTGAGSAVEPEDRTG